MPKLKWNAVENELDLLSTDAEIAASVWMLPPVDEWYDPTGGLPGDGHDPLEDPPEVGDRYIAEVDGNGWVEDYIYEWNGEEWVESAPTEGWMVWMILEAIFYFFFSGGWMEVGYRSFLDLEETNWTAVSPLAFDTDTTQLSIDLSGYLELDQSTHQHVINGAPHFDGGAVLDTPAIILKSGQRLVFDG